MPRKKVEDTVTELVTPIVDQEAFELVDVEFLKEGANWYLRVYIDKPGGIMIDDCQFVSEKLSDLLDEVDPIEQSYILEVSSPGIDRPLKKEKDFVKYKGELVEVKLYKPQENRKVFEGELVGLIEGKVVIRDEKGNNLAFDRELISTVRRVVQF